MNNEQTQAEMLADEATKRICKSFHIASFDSALVEGPIRRAITQATAELRAENEQLQSQVAALVELLKSRYKPCFGEHCNCPACSEVACALVDTQATADAHDAKVREAAIRGVSCSHETCHVQPERTERR